MRISVVLPTHNRIEFLREAIASVQRQTWADWELIVVDDGSQPSAPRCTADDSNQPVKWLRNESAQGLSGARNRGMAAAEGDIVIFLDDDDLLADDALAAVAKAFETLADLECLFINVEPFGEGARGMRENQARTLTALLAKAGVPENGESPVPLGPQLFGALLDGLPLALQRVAIRKALLQRVGPLQPGPFGDMEWNFRVALRCHCWLLRDPLYRVRCSGQSFFSRNDAKARLADAVIRVHLQLAALPEVSAQPQLASKVKHALARSRFEKAYLAHTEQRQFPWRDFVLSVKSAPAWRHASLLARACLSRLRGTGKPQQHEGP